MATTADDVGIRTSKKTPGISRLTTAPESRRARPPARLAGGASPAIGSTYQERRQAEPPGHADAALIEYGCVDWFAYERYEQISRAQAPSVSS